MVVFSPMSSSFIHAIRSQFPADFLKQDPETLTTYGKDWTKVYAPKPSGVVFPRTTEEVAKFVALCDQYGQALVPSGGRTGLAGGAVASNGEWVLSLEKMNRMGEVDPLSQTVRVQAGAITEAVHKHCEPHGLTWPVDFSSKGSSQVGGNLATNAGGVKVIHYGMTRYWALGLQVVVMPGSVLELNGALEKNNTGADLKQLFIGSEGTLGIITEATLKLTRLPEALSVFFFALQDMNQVLRLFLDARRAPFKIHAFECLTQNCMEAVQEHLKLTSPFQQPAGAYALLEVERPAHPEAQQRLDQWLESVFERGLALDGTQAQSPREARDLWALREGIAESLYHKAFLHKNDIALPLASLEAFIGEMDQLFKQEHPDLEICFFGHIGDGNLHINTLKPQAMSKEKFLDRCHHADQQLFELVRRYQGSISGEHGIGLLKKEALPYSRSPEELRLLKVIKQGLDPKNLMNPGKIF